LGGSPDCAVTTYPGRYDRYIVPQHVLETKKMDSTNAGKYTNGHDQDHENQLAKGDELAGAQGDLSDNSEIDFAKPADYVAALGKEEPEKEPRRQSAIIPIKMPQEKDSIYFKVHPSKEFIGVYRMLKHKNEYFFVSKAILLGLPKDVRNRLRDYELVTAITLADDDIFLLPVPHSSEKSLGDWASSLAGAIEEAKERYIKLLWNDNLMKRDFEPLPEDEIVPAGKPRWPDGLTYDFLIKKASKARAIKSLDDPILRKIRGLPAGAQKE
jgi:hypothetical protein